MPTVKQAPPRAPIGTLSPAVAQAKRSERTLSPGPRKTSPGAARPCSPRPSSSRAVLSSRASPTGSSSPSDTKVLKPKAVPSLAVPAKGDSSAAEITALRHALAASQRACCELKNELLRLSSENEQLKSLVSNREVVKDEEQTAATDDDGGEVSATVVDSNDAPRAVVLVGVTGSGKSSVGCALAGIADAFGISGGLASATSGAESADYTYVSSFRSQPSHESNGSGGTGGSSVRRAYRVIDTIGLQDTSFSSAEVIRRFTAFTSLCPAPGVSLFLFVLPFGRFKPEHEAALDAFAASCGEDVLEHTILVFTHCQLSPAELRQHLVTSAPQALRRILPKLAYPTAFPADVVAAPARAQRALRAAVDDACDALCEERYSLHSLQAAREQKEAGQEEDERAAFAAAVADWRKGANSAE